MGNSISSIFDCAVNPLHPAAPDEQLSEEGPPKPVVIEEARPLRDSVIWALQRAFYSEKGVRAWSDALVPNFVTSNSFIAKAYAKVILGLIRDTFEGGPDAAAASGVDPARPVYIIELGAGHGKLGYLIVETLLRYRSFFPATRVPNGVPFKYVMTDAFVGSVDAWAQHPSLREFIEAGVIDVAVFDAERDTSITLRFSGEVLAPPSSTSTSATASSSDSSGNPMLVIANYVFDSLTVDAFRVSEGVLEQACLSIVSSAQEDKERERDRAAAAETAAATGAPPDDANTAATAGDNSSSSSGSSHSSRSDAGAADASHPALESALIRRMTPAWSYIPLVGFTGMSSSSSSSASSAAAGGSAPSPRRLDGSGAPHPGDIGAAANAALSAQPRASPRSLAAAAAAAAAAKTGTVYGDALLDSLLLSYASTPSLHKSASLLVPLGGVRAVRSLLSIARGKLVLLLGDKGYTRLGEMEGHRDPHMAIHGSFSFMTNFHAIRELVKAFGGSALTTPYLDGFKVAAYFFGSPSVGQTTPLVPVLPAPRGLRASLTASTASAPSSASAGRPFVDSAEEEAVEFNFGALAQSPLHALVAGADTSPTTAAAAPPVSSSSSNGDGAGVALGKTDAAAAASPPHPYAYTRWAFREGIQSFGPEDFSTLQRCVKEECLNPSLKLVLALLRLANHDAEVFYKFKQVLIDKSTYPQTPDNLQRDVRGDVDRVYASYYPLVPTKDVCFELGRVLMGLREYATAIEFFNKSNELCGQHHVTWHNAGISFYYLGDYESALECFKASLELAPNYGEARIWWEKTSLKSTTMAPPTDDAGQPGAVGVDADAGEEDEEHGGSSGGNVNDAEDGGAELADAADDLDQRQGGDTGRAAAGVAEEDGSEAEEQPE